MATVLPDAMFSLPKAAYTDEKLRIAIVAPLFYTVPPGKYGGTERVVAYLIHELIARGHTVTLYAPNGCQTGATLVECTPLTLDAAGVQGTIPDMEPPYTMQLRRVMADRMNYDVIHIHHGILPFQPKILNQPGPYLLTDHTELDVEDKAGTLQKLLEHATAGATSVSDSQRDIISGAQYWLGTVFNGIPKYLLAPIVTTKPTYLAFLGRLSPEKGAPDAVRIAVLAGKHLKVAAKFEMIHRDYIRANVTPLFEKHHVEYIGEIEDREKSNFLSGAIALVFPIQWKEPFGLVMIEAMACGTPVIAYNKGAVPEVVEEGVTGFIVNTPEEAAAKVVEASNLDRKRIRHEFEQKYTSAVMTEKYLDIYRRIRAGNVWDFQGNVNEVSGVKSNDDTKCQHLCPQCHSRLNTGGKNGAAVMTEQQSTK